MGCSGKKGVEKDQYMMFVRCPVETQGKDRGPNTVMTTNERISKLEEAQGRLEGKVDALIKHMEHLLERFQKLDNLHG